MSPPFFSDAVVSNYEEHFIQGLGDLNMVAWNSFTGDVAEVAVRMATDKNSAKENAMVTAMNKGADTQLDPNRILNQLPQTSRSTDKTPSGGLAF